MGEGRSRVIGFPPSFDLGRCYWLLKLELWNGPQGSCIRLLFEYYDRSNVAIVARDVLITPHFLPAPVPGMLPFAPFDIGELLVSDQGDKVVLYDELKGWRIVAKFLEFEVLEPSLPQSS